MNLKQKIKTLTLEEKAKHLLAEVPNEILDEKYTIAEFVDLPMGFAVWAGVIKKDDEFAISKMASVIGDYEALCDCLLNRVKMGEV